MFDYHVHTRFSADAEMTMAEACARAAGLGIAEIAFTEHVDYYYPGSPLKWEFDTADYEREAAACERRYEGRPAVIRAAEIGMHPESHARNREFVASYPFDFLIGSVHIVGDDDLDNGDFFRNRTVAGAGRAYLEAVYHCVCDYTDFNVLGHPDLFKRYLHFLNADRGDVRWADHIDIIKAIFRRLIETGRGIELNMSGYRAAPSYTLPEPEMVKLYRRMGGEIITVGSDAHRVEQVGLAFDVGYEILEWAGFRYVTTFRRREPDFRPLR